MGKTITNFTVALLAQRSIIKPLQLQIMTEKKENEPYELYYVARCGICGVEIHSGEQTLNNQQQMTYLANLHFNAQHPDEMVQLDIDIDIPSAA